MLKDILKIIDRDGYISRVQLARELNVNKEIIDDGIEQLLRMGFLVEEETGDNCASYCSKCLFAKSCNKEIVKTYRMSSDGVVYLKNADKK
jgi:hypothetical protein